ncbi:hypothetical protein [Litoreibacter janthinus]|uniref:Uncharacterized protein n=1 Tax=Litoreibacter janthinus TaxID=670154 RepID=A0A1I6FTR0_9RHOB|nr:hypothetical protein [Litoreibacter janthinus]SFR33311.1 hypothetical protein SAMN04488002_0300 [Litoreibacter janthinus]
MIEFLPKEIEDGLAAARLKAATKKTRLRVQSGEDMIPLVRLAGNHFAIEKDLAPRLRGLVDIYDGARHLYQALVVATSFDGEAVVFEFKRNTATANGPALDFAPEDDAPIGLLPRA